MQNSLGDNNISGSLPSAKKTVSGESWHISIIKIKILIHFDKIN
jgi:hypothetical protein